MSLVQDISFISGDTVPIDGDLTNVNLTGAVVRFFLRTSKDSTVNIITKASNAGTITVTDPAQGKFTFTLSSTETSSLNGSYFYKIEVSDTFGNVTTVTTGTLSTDIVQDVLSYVTVGYADSYFSNNVLFPEPWNTTDENTKVKALRMATKKIDSLPLIGRKADEGQALMFPRCLYSDSYGVWFTEPKIAQVVLEATCEEALALLRGGKQAQQRQQLQRQGVTSFSLGALSEAYSGAYGETGKLMSPEAARLMSIYTGGGRSIS